MSRKLLGEIVDHGGMLCLSTSPGMFYPLGGSSGIASDFRETFNLAQPSDVGRQLWRVGGVLQMESVGQRNERLAKEDLRQAVARLEQIDFSRFPGLYDAIPWAQLEGATN